MFYLLKGTNDREIIGDVIIDKEAIDAILVTKIITKEETYWKLKVSMKSGGDDYIVCFNTDEEAREAIKSLGVDEEIASQYVISTKDKEKEKERRMKDILEHVLS